MSEDIRIRIARILHDEVYYPNGDSIVSGAAVLPFDEQGPKWKKGMAEMEVIDSLLAVLKEE